MADLEGRIIKCDAREGAGLLMPGSVDLILTDPVYDNLSDYSWLAETGQWVLRDDGNLLAFASRLHTAHLRDLMGHFLTYIWELGYVVKGRASKLRAYNIYVWNTPVLWFSNGRGKASAAIPDTFISGGPPQGKHKWNKNLSVLKYWINAFTRPGDLVLDPFMGSGSVPVACKETGRQYIGFERDAASFQQARRRLDAAKTPLLVPDGEVYQVRLWDDEEPS